MSYTIVIILNHFPQYIQRVLQYRSHLYHPSPVPEILINDIPNGSFLNKVLHAEFAHGDIAFLKVCNSHLQRPDIRRSIIQTPNFALNPDDIPRNLIQTGDPTPLNRITLQELLHDDYAEVSTDNSRDANFRGESNLQNLRPPSILLDYMYGIAAYKHWKTDDSHAMVNQYFTDNYKSIPIPPLSDPSGSDTSDSHRQGHNGRDELFDDVSQRDYSANTRCKVAGRGEEEAVHGTPRESSESG